MLWTVHFLYMFTDDYSSQLWCDLKFLFKKVLYYGDPIFTKSDH